MIRPWGDPALTRPERQDFVESVLGPDNLQRMFWFIVAFLPISVGGLIVNAVLVQNQDIVFWNYFDLGLSLLFLALTVIARKKGHAIRWKHPLVLIYACYALVSMDGYYFGIRPDFGENAYFVLGMLMVAILFRMPPRQFLSLLILNFLAYVLFLVPVVKDRGELIVALFSGFNALVIALLAAWFLFNKDWQNFENKREVAEANALLTRRNAELNDVMAIAAHDLRSPLYSVKMLFDLSLKEVDRKDPVEMTALFRDGSRACSDMLGLIERLLNAHAVEHREAGPQIRPVNLSQIALDVITRYLIMATAKDITLRQEFPKVIEAMTDPDIFLQALDNLVSNAIKYSPRGAVVTIALEETVEEVVIEVRDNGPGISDPDQTRVFDKYYRGPNLPSEGRTSSGLGLYIVKQFAEALGGAVSYRPNVPHGGIFRISLPRER